MNTNILLVTPPFLQFNTPYPAMLYLYGFLKSQKYAVQHYDLNIHTARKIFSSSFLKKLYLKMDNKKLPTPFPGFSENRNRYLSTIDPVMAFLSGKNATYAHRILSRHLLPEGPHFNAITEDCNFSQFDATDRSRYLATLYMEDIAYAISRIADPGFEIIRYRESMGMGAHHFSDMEDQLGTKPTEVEKIYLDLLENKIETENPTIIAFTIPFPGTLFAVLRCSTIIKKLYPNIIICAGGGFVNTELRSLSNTDFFNYIDYLFFDDGEAPFKQFLNVYEGQSEKEALFNCAFKEDGNVRFAPSYKSRITDDTLYPDYSETDPDLYISMFDSQNPMMRLWNDGFWNKLTLAHGCYWSKCTFCDTSLDYIKNFKALDVQSIISRIRSCIVQTGESGFHFTDEAAPPALLKKLAIELLRANISCSYWTNIRFDDAFTADLAKLLFLSGCIALSGGVEVASTRLLSLIKKGVTIEQLARTTRNLSSAGILIHAYLMYGYPTQNEQETIDSLEVVRQLFENQCIDSAYWHKFSLTCHSAVYLSPNEYSISVKEDEFDFCHNDVNYREKSKTEHSVYSEGLNNALFNYMNGVELKRPVEKWFRKKVPTSTVNKQFIKDALKSDLNSFDNERSDHMVFFIAHIPVIELKGSIAEMFFSIFGEEYSLKITKPVANNLSEFFKQYPLYSELQIDVGNELLSKALMIGKNKLFFDETFTFLREFSLLMI
ncbi:MAG: radical SAM protein [Spirochaetes bacterium]|jgi:radical SAM superfamily enzyme YgiQ (UPF0313 family)|nr:radical SAM protein [Spirochaetota bacterium]